MSDKVLRVGILTPVRTMDPRGARELVSTLASAQVYETPYDAPKGEGPAVPLLFEPLQSEGPAVVSARIRPGVTFSDGTPLDPARAAASLSSVDALRERAVVEAQPDRVVFRLKAPNPRFDLTLTLHHCAITLDKGGTLLGTGPYVLAPGSSQAEPRLVKNPRWRGKVSADEIVFKVYPPNADGRPEALMAAIASGEVDFTNMLSRTDAASVQNVRKLFQPASATAILFQNTERPALAAPIVRRAVAHAVDRMAVAQISYTNALAFAASGLLPPTMGTFRDTLGHDPERAKALFAQAPAPKPTSLRLATVWAPRPYLPNPQPVAELIAKQLGVLGLDVRIVAPASSDEFYRLTQRGDYDLLLGGWIADTPDPADFLEAVLRSDRVQSTETSSLPRANRARLRSPEMDEALRLFREDPTAAHRDAVLKLLDDLAPVVPLMYGPSVIVNSWRVKNLEASWLGVPHFAAAVVD